MADGSGRRLPMYSSRRGGIHGNWIRSTPYAPARWASLLAAGAALLFLVREYVGSVEAQVLLGGSGLVLISIACLRLLPEPRLLNLHAYVFAGAGVTFGLAPLSLLAIGRSVAHGGYGIYTIPPAHTVAAGAITAYAISLGAISWVGRGGRRFNALEDRREISADLLVALTVIGLGARAGQVFTARGGYVQDVAGALADPSRVGAIFSVLNGVLFAGILAGSYYAARDRDRRLSVIFASIAVVTAAVSLLSAGKEDVIAPFALFLLGRVLAGTVDVRKLLLVTAAGALVAAWVFPTVTNYRSHLRSSSHMVTTYTEAVPIFLDVLADPDQVQFAEGMASMARRASTVGALGVAVDAVPDRSPHYGMSRFAPDTVTTSIPRVMWPDKPVIAPGRQAAIEIFGTSEAIFTSATLTTPGYAYRYAGIWSVVLAFAALAFLVAIANRVTQLSLLERFVLLGFMIRQLVKLESPFDIIVAGMVQAVLCILLIRLALYLGARRGARPRDFETPRSDLANDVSVSGQS